MIPLDQLQLYLVAQSIGQMPETAPSESHPVIYTMPRTGGAPLPRKNEAGKPLEKITITLQDASVGAGKVQLETFLEETIVDVIVRAEQANDAKLTHRAIRNLLSPIGALRGRSDWMMNELRVLYSEVFTNEQPLPPLNDGITYDRIATFRIVCTRASLAV